MKYVYSNSLNEMVEKGFTRIKTRDNGKIFKTHYTWDDMDCVYYNDDVDDDYYMEIPQDNSYEDYKGKYTVKIILD